MTRIAEMGILKGHHHQRPFGEKEKTLPDLECIGILHRILVMSGDTVDGRNPKQPPGMYKTL